MTTQCNRIDPADEPWVRALQRREEWAWKRLHEETLERVFAYVHRHCSRREEAEDITAEVYAAAVAAINRFRGDAGVLTWLIGIARRKLIDAARRRGRRPELLETDLAVPMAEMPVTSLAGGPAGSESPEAALERRDTQGRLHRMLRALPEAQREALLLHCLDDLSLAEVGRALGRSESAVKGLIYRAKALLRERMNAELPGQQMGRWKEPHDAEA